LCLIHTGAQFTLDNVIARAENVDGPTPTVRVTWNTTVPLECVASVMVEFRTQSSVVTNTTTNTLQTEVIQTGLRCTTNYNVAVIVTGESSDARNPTVRSRPVQVFVGGKEIMCMRFNWYSSLMVVMLLP